MLTSKTVTQFLDELASNSPAPGGGSVAALAGALSAGLTSMVCRLTIGKKKYADVQDEMENILNESEQLRSRLTLLIDEDTVAFNEVMAAFSLPKDTPEQQQVRGDAIQSATKKASLVPLEVMRLSARAASLAKGVAEKGNKNSITDAGVACLAARAAYTGAMMNVLINLSSIKDQEFVTATRQTVDMLLASADDSTTKAFEQIQAGLG
ncbi:MAG: cyclodeaminase/cyclohydrolase family protein [Ignavibacteriales bacterium]|nr:cyclodeaminase/cyclohydrolase family protein [Ignavibacteriales bacterium]